jgi:ribosomal protein L11 methylase PrmA
LLNLVPELNKHLKPGGKMLLSGLLSEDESKMLEVTNQELLIHVSTRHQEEWIAMLLRK